MSMILILYNKIKIEPITEVKEYVENGVECQICFEVIFRLYFNSYSV